MNPDALSQKATHGRTGTIGTEGFEQLLALAVQVGQQSLVRAEIAGFAHNGGLYAVSRLGQGGYKVNDDVGKLVAEIPHSKVAEISAVMVQDAGREPGVAGYQRVTFAIVLLFDRPIAEDIFRIVPVASHIPKFWDVTSEDRVLAAQLFKRPRVLGSVLHFEVEYEGLPHTLARLQLVIEELAERMSGKKFLLGERDFVQCRVAFGGPRNEVRRNMLPYLKGPVEITDKSTALLSADCEACFTPRPQEAVAAPDVRWLDRAIQRAEDFANECVNAGYVTAGQSLLGAPLDALQRARAALIEASRVPAPTASSDGPAP